MAPETERTALVVLGVHRSGTSAITRVVSLLGAELPPRLLAPVAGENDRGFWESPDIMALHERLLDRLGTHWADPAPLEPAPLDPAWAGSAAAREFEDELVDLLGRLFPTAPLFVVKDPRMCRLAPLWSRALRRHGATPRFILTARHPLEVAQSLAARDGLPVAHGLALWLANNIDAEAATRGECRTFAHFEDLLLDWGAVAARMGARMGMVWPKSLDEARAEVDAFLVAGLRRHRAARGVTPDQSPLFRYINAWHDAHRAAAGGDPAAADAFERLAALVQPRAQWSRRRFERPPSPGDRSGPETGPSLPRRLLNFLR